MSEGGREGGKKGERETYSQLLVSAYLHVHYNQNTLE